MLFWLLAGIVGLVVFVILALQLPFVQNLIKDQVVSVARETLGTDVGIGRLRVDFPHYVEVDDVYVNNPAGDSIARLGHLGVGVNMWALIRSTVQLDEIVIDDVYANVVTTDSSSNIQFLLDAFLPDVDTLAAADSPAADSVAASPGGWLIDAEGAELSLNRADIYYQDDPAGLLADVTARSLRAEINGLDLTDQVYDIDHVDLDGTSARIVLGQSSTPADTTTTEAAAMRLLAGRLTIEDSRLDLGMDSLQLGIGLPYVNLEGAELDLGERLAFVGELFQLRDFAFSMDTPAPELAGPGMDFNHLALTEVGAEATDISYVVDSLHLELRQLTARERSGFHLQRTEGTIDYDPSFLGLADFLLRTEHSELRSGNTAVRFDFASADLEQLVARAQLSGFLGLRDVALLAPDLRDVPVVGTNLGQRVTFDLRADGTMADLNVDRIQLDGPGVRIRATGRGQHLLDTNRLGGRLLLREFVVTPGPLLPLLPDGMLPADIDWPRRIVAEGEATYRNNTLDLDLYAIENRTFGNGLDSRVRTSGRIAGLTTFPRTRLNVRLDTLLATRATVLAYVPPGTLPEDYQIPDFVRGSGSVSGPMDNLDVDLRLSLPGEQTFARLNGNVRNALDPDRLNLDLEVSDLAVSIADVKAILPDSLLPANLNLPDLRVRNARLSGSLTDLEFAVPLKTTNGNWDLRGRYNPADLDLTAAITGVRLPELFTGPVSDSLATLDLGPLDIYAQVDGRLEPSMDLVVDATIAQNGGDSLVHFNALVEDGSYAAAFEALHPALRGNGKGKYVIGPDSVARVEGVVDINRFDLEFWDLTDAPMVVDGRLTARSVGLDPYNLEAYARLDSVRLRGATGSSYVDSLAVTASLHDWKNEVYVRSDVLDAELLGFFDPVNTPTELVNFLIGYYDPTIEQPDPVESGRKLDFALQLKRPQPLTGGLINGLTKLSPFETSLLYRDATPELLFNLELRELVYAGLEAHNLVMKAVGDTSLLTWEANWADIEYGDQVELGKTRLSGENVDDRLLVELKLFTETDSLRHYLGLYVQPTGDSLTVQLEEEQILNFDTWTVPATNLISVAGPNLVIRDLVLRNGEQLLSARTTEPNDVEVVLENFQLRTPSRLLFSEEEVMAGEVNGTVGIDNALSQPGIRSDLRVDDLSWTGQPVGDITAEVTSSDESTYLIDVKLDDAGNDVRIRGAYVLDGEMDLSANVGRLQLSSVEPFSLGYLENSEGYLSGRVDIGGTATAPRLDGNLRFNETSFVISLLGERFRLSDQPIQFTGDAISFGSNYPIYDSEGNAARLSGGVDLGDLTAIELDMRVVAEDFIAVNSDKKDNPDWYGYLSVDAEVDIGGTAVLPVIDVRATTNENSDVTYVYSVPAAGLADAKDIVAFAEEYQWRNIIRRDTLEGFADTVATTGIDMTLELDIDPNAQVTVVIDPATQQEFTGRADGDLTIQIFPDGRMEANGRVEVTEGKYDFVFQKVLSREFFVLEGSSVTFTGELENPQLDLRIRHKVKTSGRPLVEALTGTAADVAGLSRTQTFYVDVTLKGDLTASQIVTDVKYPEDEPGNLGLVEIENALATLRQDESRITSTTFQLLDFNSFNIPLLDAGAGGGGPVYASTLNNLMSSYLNSFADQLIGFVDLDFGLDSYQNESGENQTNLRVSLQKTLFNDRIIISVDGVAGTEADEVAGTNQTYLDNITAEYLINEDGTFRLKFFNDRERDILVGGNVIRFGGRVTFGKDFESLGWGRKNQN